ncbi:Reverse transcriptase-like [Sesbania bispinosa]|nr:Reverse transcriptase-like [Sesbania bispinosa]
MGEIMLIVQDILEYKKHFSYLGFTWVGRDGNKAAHLIAQMEERDLIQRNWPVCPPPELSTS